MSNGLEFKDGAEETLWMRAVIAVAESSNVERASTAISWADHLVIAFRTRRSPASGYRKVEGA